MGSLDFLEGDDGEPASYHAFCGDLTNWVSEVGHGRYC